MANPTDPKNEVTNPGETTWSVQLTQAIVTRIKSLIKEKPIKVVDVSVRIINDGDSDGAGFGEWLATLKINGFTFIFDKDVGPGNIKHDIGRLLHVAWASVLSPSSFLIQCPGSLISTPYLGATASSFSISAFVDGAAVVAPWVFDITVEVSDLIPNSAVFAAVGAMQTLFNNARNLLLRKDSASDWRAAVQFNVVTSIEFIHTPPGGSFPDPVNNLQAERDKHYNAAADVVFVNSMPGAAGITNNCHGSSG